jgi:glucan phosphoethanolaminetransferase (alkaline phosphatase superfamily)
MYVPSILQNRAYLIIIIGFLTTITALGPFFVGYTFTTVLAVHEILHIAAITFGGFLMLVSIFAYDTTRNTNMIFTALAFLTFTLLSIFLLEEDLNTDLAEHDEAVVVDVLLTVMIGLFAIGVFYNQKSPDRTKYN